MDQSSLDNIKKEYKLYQDSMRKVKNLEKEKKEYEQLPFIKKYLELAKELKEAQIMNVIHKEGTDQEIIERVVNHHLIPLGKKMFSYLETTKDFIYYANLEDEIISDSNYIQEIPVEKVKEFEENNIVLYPPRDMDPKEYYNTVRYLYFATAIEDGQEEAYALIRELKEKNEQELKR